jgi:hypothetical protein
MKDKDDDYIDYVTPEKRLNPTPQPSWEEVVVGLIIYCIGLGFVFLLLWSVQRLMV